MTKKEYLIAVADALPQWEMGQKIKERVLNDSLDKQTIDKLVTIYEKVMTEIVSEIKKQKMIEKLELMNKKNDIIQDLLKELTTSDYLSSLVEKRIQSLGEPRTIAPKKYQVFISSTFTDLEVEREKVMNTVMNLGCIPAGMEHFPATDEEQFNYIKKVIDTSDYYVLILGGRYGTMTKEGISFTEREFDYAKKKGIPILAFLHKNIGLIPLNKSEINEKSRDKLASFYEKAKTGRLVQFWETPEELCLNVSTSLSHAMNNFPATGWERR